MLGVNPEDQKVCKAVPCTLGPSIWLGFNLDTRSVVIVGIAWIIENLTIENSVYQ